MADSSLIAVVVGGVIGIAGSLTGPLILEWRKQVAEKKKKRSEKLEELVSELAAYQSWLLLLHTAVEPGKDMLVALAKSPPISFSKAEAICTVYFPEFQADIKALSAASAKYTLWVSQGGQPNIGNPPEPLRIIKLIEEKIRDYAKREFQ